VKYAVLGTAWKVGRVKAAIVSCSVDIVDGSLTLPVMVLIAMA
jgi:hypothetical protein